jgi:hypothetical protein
MNKIKIFILLSIFLNSCNILNFAKGVKEDSNNAMNINRQFFYENSFNGIYLDKFLILKNDTLFMLKIKVITIDSVPNITNRSYYDYFSFKAIDTLIININKEMYLNVRENDTIAKLSNSFDLIRKNKESLDTFKWLSNSKEWLYKK